MIGFNGPSRSSSKELVVPYSCCDLYDHDSINCDLQLINQSEQRCMMIIMGISRGEQGSASPHIIRSASRGVLCVVIGVKCLC